jgi:hypothetical protein
MQVQKLKIYLCRLPSSLIVGQFLTDMAKNPCMEYLDCDNLLLGIKERVEKVTVSLVVAIIIAITYSLSSRLRHTLSLVK